MKIAGKIAFKQLHPTVNFIVEVTNFNKEDKMGKETVEAAIKEYFKRIHEDEARTKKKERESAKAAAEPET